MLAPPPLSPRVLLLQPSPWHADPAAAHYRAAPAYTFHAYSPPASPPPDDVAPPAMSTKRASRLTAPFPTFLYANEPPPVTARNKQRVRPSPAQLADLKAVYAATAHPTREEREALGRRIGMRYQSVTNWFQNQRSTAKKRGPAAMHHMAHSPEHDDEDAAPPPPPPPSPPHYHQNHHHHHTPAPRRTDPVRDIIAQSSRPPQNHQLLPPLHPHPHPPRPPTPHLPLPLSGTAILPTHPLPPPPTHHHPRPLLSSFQVSRTPTPAGTLSDPAPPRTQPHRGKRSRPTPHQLAVLRALHAETASPSIEARVRVGQEIGMELGKVTNWFRNLRQTARKKERRALEEGGGAGHKRPRGDEDEDEDDASPLHKRTRLNGDDEESASEDEDSMDGSMDADEEQRESSELGTESDAAHEAVTPEPVGAPPPLKHGAAASVDDALLLLALHDART